MHSKTIVSPFWVSTSAVPPLGVGAIGTGKVGRIVVGGDVGATVAVGDAVVGASVDVIAQTSPEYGK